MKLIQLPRIKLLNAHRSLGRLLHLLWPGLQMSHFLPDIAVFVLMFQCLHLSTEKSSQYLAHEQQVCSKAQEKKNKTFLQLCTGYKIHCFNTFGIHGAPPCYQYNFESNLPLKITFLNVLIYQTSIILVIPKKTYVSGLQRELNNLRCVKLVLCCITRYIQEETNKTNEDMIWHIVRPESVCLFNLPRVICPRYFSPYHHLHNRQIQLTWLLIQTM